MKVGILHLSDIHIENADDWICNKGQKIAQAILGTWEQLHTIFIVISGDVANKGYADQYSVAHGFFLGIRDYLQQQKPSIKVFFIAAPGNHDCDFSEGNLDLKARKAFIDTVIRNPSDITRGDSIYKGCLSVQENFFNFVRGLDTKVEYPTQPEIFYKIEINIDTHTFYFNIFNTAWLSQIQEGQGNLVFPCHLINCDPEKLSQGAFSLSVFHHPDNWLDNNNAAEFRRVIEQNSDIILSGHEHYREVYSKRHTDSDIEAQIIKAGALQERSQPDSSNFNLVIVDVDNKKQKLFEFKWKEVEYKRKKENDWKDFVRNRFLQKHSFYLLPDFEILLNSLGSLTANSRNRTIHLEDFFLTPRLAIISLKDVIDGKKYRKKVEAAKFFEFIHTNKKVIIFGETWQGKTTVAKKVFKDLYAHQFATLLVDGSKFHKAKEDHFRKVLKEEFSNQYDGNLWDRFLQLPKEKRALIIDNFGLSGLTQQSLQALLKIAEEYFEYVIVFAHRDLEIQQYVSSEQTGQAKLSNYTHSDMLHLDQSQRTELIRRWVRFDAGTTAQESELIKQENQLRTMVQTAINNGLIPSTPFYIFGVLQLIESFKNNPTAQFGSIGYIYQGVITSRLAEQGKTPAQIDRAFLVISLIAHWQYVNNQDEIEEEDLEQIIKTYNQNYRQNINSSNFLSQLQSAKILIKQANSNWKFVGSQLRDFFVAKYFAQALGEEDSREQEEAVKSVRLMIETIVFEPHTRILLFLVYEANSNKKLIRWILNEAKKVYGNVEVTDLDSDVQFINKLKQSMLERNLLQSGDPRENQDIQDKALSNDEEDSDVSITDEFKKNLVKYSDELDQFTKAAFALKMIELVGQLVKSFSGTIKAELKQQLIEECIDVGLRLLRSIFQTNNEHFKDLENILKHLIRQQNPDLSERNVENRKDELMIIIHHGMTYGIIKKISLSVGHTDLKESFSDIFKAKELLSYKLVEMAIKLDHYAPLADKIIKFSKEQEIKDNKFAYSILRQLLADYINYFDVERIQRDKLIAEFGLNGGPEYLLNTTKEERTLHLQPRKGSKYSPPERKK